MKTLANLLTVLLLLTFAACGGEADTEAPAPPETSQAEANTSDAAVAHLEDGVQVAEIEAGATGYHPSRITLQAGVPARLVFTRTADAPCLEQVQVPAFGIEATDLPMNQPVSIEFTPAEDGEYTFVCGMNMQHGTLVVTS